MENNQTQTDQQVQAIQEPKTDVVNQNVNPNKNTSSPHHFSGGILTAVIVCSILSVIGLIIGIVNICQITQLSTTVDEINKERGIAESPSGNRISYCELPTSAQEIQFADLLYNGPDNQITIYADGQIEYNYTITDANGNGEKESKIIDVDTSDIMQHIYTNDLGYFSIDTNTTEEIDENAEKWSVIIEMENNNICTVDGYGTTPEWFNSLLNLANAKKDI